MFLSNSLQNLSFCRSSLGASSSHNSITLDELDSVSVINLSAGSGVITLQGGTFRLASAGVVSDASAVVVSLAAVLDLNGFNETIGSLAAGGAVTVNNAGTLGGTGTINGAVTVATGGTVSPGVSGPGSLSTGSVTFAPGSWFVVQLNGLAAGQYDQLNVTGSVHLGGSALVVSLGFTPANASCPGQTTVRDAPGLWRRRQRPGPVAEPVTLRHRHPPQGHVGTFFRCTLLRDSLPGTRPARPIDAYTTDCAYWQSFWYDTR